MYKVILYDFCLCEADYVLLIDGSKGLSQGAWFFITGFHILMLHKNLVET